MSISPNSGSTLPPQPEPRYQIEPPPVQERNWLPVVTIVGLVVLAIANFLVFYNLSDTRKQLEQQIAELKERNSVLERRLAVGDERHNSLRGEVLMTREKLGVTERDLSRARALAVQVGQEQKQTEAKLGQQLGQVNQQVSTLREESGQKIAAVTGEVAGAKSDIAATRKDLEQTKIQLTSAIGDISKASTLIARNHDELLELRRRGERNYVEFDLPKEKQPRRVGEVSMQLKKTDPRRQKYTLLIVAEDMNNEKKDKTVNEPVQFYMGRTRTLYEVVVNRVSKDRITGYLATPK